MAREPDHFEWRNPRNWSGRGWLWFYHSPRDSRLLVPKRLPLMGWTLNLSHRWGRVAMLALVLGIAVAAARDLALLGG